MLDKDIAERRRLWKVLDERDRALLDDDGANKLVNEEKHATRPSDGTN